MLSKSQVKRLFIALSLPMLIVGIWFANNYYRPLMDASWTCTASYTEEPCERSKGSRPFMQSRTPQVSLLETQIFAPKTSLGTYQGHFVSHFMQSSLSSHDVMFVSGPNKGQQMRIDLIGCTLMRTRPEESEGVSLPSDYGSLFFADCTLAKYHSSPPYKSFTWPDAYEAFYFQNNEVYEKYNALIKSAFRDRGRQSVLEWIVLVCFLLSPMIIFWCGFVLIRFVGRLVRWVKLGPSNKEEANNKKGPG